MLITPKPDRPIGDSTGKIWNELIDGKAYRVIEIDSGYYRIQPTDHLPSLYPCHLFNIVDGAVEPHWTVSVDDDGDVSLLFPQSTVAGFWEDVHDKKTAALQELASILNHMAQRE